jgi:hypothetical protein
VRCGTDRAKEYPYLYVVSYFRYRDKLYTCGGTSAIVPRTIVWPCTAINQPQAKPQLPSATLQKHTTCKPELDKICDISLGTLVVLSFLQGLGGHSPYSHSLISRQWMWKCTHTNCIRHHGLSCKNKCYLAVDQGQLNWVIRASYMPIDIILRPLF